MILKDAIIEQINKDIKYHVDGAKNARSLMKNKKSFFLASKLESIMITCETPKNVCPTSYGSLTIIFETFEGARDFVSRAMDKLGLDKIERDMEKYSSELKWYYTINYCPEDADASYYLHVYPAQPVEGCTPRRIAESRSPQMRWVCEKDIGHE